MQVTVKRFHFESAKDPGYVALLAEAKVRGIHPMEANGDHKDLLPDGAVYTVTDSARSIHNNQFSTVEGQHVFDMRILCQWDARGNRVARRVGYILADDDGFKALQEFRAGIGACGYCGARHVLADLQGEGPHFCDKCAGSQFLKESDLQLLQILPLTLHFPKRKAAVPEWLLTEYRAKQRDTSQRKAREGLARKLEALERKRANLALEGRLIEALAEAGLEWRLIENLIHYEHTGRFCFGWREPLAPVDYDKIRFLVKTAKLDGFPIDYKVKES